MLLTNSIRSYINLKGFGMLWQVISWKIVVSLNNYPIKTWKCGKVKLCSICGDHGFTNLVVTCKQCNEGAEQVNWWIAWRPSLIRCLKLTSFGAKYKSEQKVSRHRIALISFHRLDKPMTSWSKKQAFGSTNAKYFCKRDSSYVALKRAKWTIWAEP